MPSNANDDLRHDGDSWLGDSEEGSGRRRRARGEKAFQSTDDSLTGRDDVVTLPVAPASRLTSLAIAVFAGLLGLALVFGAYTGPDSYLLVILGVQVLFVVSWTIATRPPGPRVVAAVGLACAVGADLAVAWPTHATIAPIGYVTAAGFIVGALGQLARRSSRERVTESLGSTLTVVVGVMAYATLIVLSRHKLGLESIAACLVAAAVGISLARLFDVVLPFPRTTPQVARGTIGIVVGAMAGTVAASLVASGLQGMSPSHTVLPGLVTALAAVLADLGVGYAEASREIDGEVGSLWLMRHMQGPLAGFALAAPVAYAMSVLVLVPALS